MGLLRGVARNYFSLEPEVELLRGRDDGSCDHEVFIVRFPLQVRTMVPNGRSCCFPPGFSFALSYEQPTDWYKSKTS